MGLKRACEVWRMWSKPKVRYRDQGYLAQPVGLSVADLRCAVGQEDQPMFIKNRGITHVPCMLAAERQSMRYIYNLTFSRVDSPQSTGKASFRWCHHSAIHAQVDQAALV